MAVFDLLKSAEIEITENQSGMENTKFPHCGISLAKIPN